jgi:hypothetical protein
MDHILEKLCFSVIISSQLLKEALDVRSKIYSAGILFRIEARKTNFWLRKRPKFEKSSTNDLQNEPPNIGISVN